MDEEMTKEGMIIDGVGNVSAGNLHGNWLFLSDGEKKYKVYVEDCTICCRGYYTKKEMHKIINTIYDNHWIIPHEDIQPPTVTYKLTKIYPKSPKKFDEKKD
jgi:hypothetical protein